MSFSAFCSINQPELELFSMFYQTTDAYFGDAALQDDLLLLEQSLAFIDYNLESFPDITSPPNFQQMIPVEELPFQTREFIGPVRSKHTNPRVLHHHAQTCNYCRDRKIKCPGKHPVCSSCRKRSTAGTWTPAIKATKRRPRSRKRGQVAHVQTYQDMVYMDMHGDASTLASAMHIQVSSAPQVDHVASQMSVVDVDFVMFDVTSSAQDPTHQDVVHMEIYFEVADSQTPTIDVDWNKFFVSDLSVPAAFLSPIF